MQDKRGCPLEKGDYTNYPTTRRKGEKMIDEGDKAPAFTLPDQNGDKVALTKQTGGWLVLFAYPKANTGG